MGICKFTYLLVLPLAPKIDADLLWDLTLVFSGLGLLYFIFVFVFRNRLAHKNKGIRLRKKELGPMISNFLFYEDDASLQEKYNYVQLKLEIRELLKDDFNRKVLVEILLDLQKDISGDARNRLFSLYKDLGLHLDAFDKLKSRRWEIISHGIMELTQLQVEESYGFIKKFINHRRGVIRKQAQIATVSLKHEGIVYFLDTCKHRISEWQQLKLLDEIRNLEDFQPPRFKAWLTAKNKDVVLFSLRLIKYYKQNDAKSSLVELVKHRNDQIKIEAINCIKEFMVFDAVDTLKSVFWKCSPSVKLVLLDTVASLGEEKEIPFLKMVEGKDSNFMVKSKAISAINTISPESVMPTHGIEDVADYDPTQEIMQTASDLIVEELQDDSQKSPAAVKNVSADTPPTSKEEPKVLSTDLEINETEEINQIEVTGYESIENVSEAIPLDWSIDADSEEMTIRDNASSDAQEQQEELFPEAEEKVSINEAKEVVMENKEEIEFDKEDMFEILQNSNPQQSNEVSLNSEEAYWEAVLDPEQEDEQIFELCFMEELDEILSQTDTPQETWAPHEILPLNFLPIIANEENEKPSEHSNRTDPIFNIEVHAEIVHEDEKFAEELNTILKRIKDAENNDETELEPDFIPLVVDNEEDEKATTIMQEELELEDSQISREVTEGITEEEQIDELAIKLPWEESEELFYLDLEQEALLNMELAYEEVVPETSDIKKQEALFELNTMLEERVSIFNELFRTCDAESKLILLDEILAVGDEKDLRFLDTLANDEDERVRKKALKISEKLKEFLNAKIDDDLNVPIKANEKTENFEDTDNISIDIEQHRNTTDPASSNDIFEIDFELNMALSQTPESDSSREGEERQTEHITSSFMDEILSLPSKIIQKLNG